MKNKKIIIITIFFSILILLSQITLASVKGEIILTPNKIDLKESDELEVKIEIKNTNIDAGIEDFLAYIEYDESIFELVKIDANQKMGELNLNSEKQEIIKEYSQEVDVLDLTNEYIVVGMDDENKYAITIIALDEIGIIEKNSTKNVGNIKFKAISNQTVTSKIKMFEISANGEEVIEDVSINQIKINIENNKEVLEQSNTEDNSIANNKTNSTNIITIGTTVVNETNKNSTKINSITNGINNKEAAQIKEELPEAGAKEAIIVFVAILIGLGLYINYRRFKEIE